MPHTSQAYLVVDASPAGPAEADLAKVLQRGRFACVLLQPGAGSGDPHLSRLVKAVQSQDVAAVIMGDPALALELAADGVHLVYDPDPDAAEAQFRAAREVLGADRIVGAGSGFARHNAMMLAESGADYVAFGDGPGGSADERLDLVGWWAEMFVVPCVAWGATNAQEARQLAGAGADFVAAGPEGGLAASAATLAGLFMVAEAAF